MNEIIDQAITECEWTTLFQQCFPEEEVPNIPSDARIIYYRTGWTCVSILGHVAHIWWGGQLMPRQGNGSKEFPIFLQYVKDIYNVTHAQLYTKRTNISMQILALKCGFLIVGCEAGTHGDLQLKFLKGL
jgi:hypothetical protein